MKRVMLTTVGTSLLTNQADDDERRVLRDAANLRTGALTPEQARVLERCRGAAAAALDGGPEAAARASAELNVLLAFHERRESELADDMHVLVVTDTAQGEAAADVLAAYLRQRGVENVQRWAPAGFSTADPRSFRRGVREVLRRCDEALPGYRACGLPVIFNTLAGFKAQRDILNIVGMFYADEILYVFEGAGAPLLRIPRLPIRIDRELFREHAAEMAQLAAYLPVGGPGRPVPPWLPETLLDEPEADGARGLSMWGYLVWDRVKDELLTQAPLTLPYIEYAPSYLRDFERLPLDGRRVRVLVQETVAEVSVLLAGSGGRTQVLSGHGGLRYGRYSGSAGALAHFRVTNSQGGLRISCEPASGGGGLRLRRVGAHDDVNETP